MTKLTEEEIQKYIKPENKSTGVDAITYEMLASIDIDKVPLLTRNEDVVTTSAGVKFKLDRFIPRIGSYFFKPSFAGTQVLIGKYADGTLLFSNGVWFVK